MCSRINFESVCYVFSLQSGVIMTIMIMSTILIASIFINLYNIIANGDWSVENKVGLLFLCSHATFAFIAIIVAFLGAYKEAFVLMFMAAFFMFLALLVYIVAAVISLIPSTYKYACFLDRCPDHIWMESSHWRRSYYEGSEAEGEGARGRSRAENVTDDDYPKEKKAPPDNIKDNEESGREETGKDESEIEESKANLISKLTGEERILENNVDPVGVMNEIRNSSGSKTSRIDLEEYHYHDNYGGDAVDDTKYCDYENVTIFRQSDVTKSKVPEIGLVISCFLTLLYLVFLVYVILVYIAFGNEIIAGMPQSFYKG